MKRVKLVSIDASKRVASSQAMPGFSDPDAARKRLGVYDLIQMEMNKGFAIGGYRATDNGDMIFLALSSDGTRVSFEGKYGEAQRPSDWKQAEHLKMSRLPMTARSDHAHLERLARERGYDVVPAKGTTWD